MAGLPADTARPFGDVPMRGTIVLQVLDTSRITNNLLPLLTRAWLQASRPGSFVSNRNVAQFTVFAGGSLRPKYELAGRTVRAARHFHL